MRAFLENLAGHSWSLTAEMAPYLLFGFAMAGLLHLLIRKAWVQRQLGKAGINSVLKACLIGVPMPLCSCSVIPVAASLRKSGASRGATAAFLSSTPQTGVDSVLATYSLLGGPFTLIRVAVAFISGIVAGGLIELCGRSSSHTAKQQVPTLPRSTSISLATSGPFSPLATSRPPLKVAKHPQASPPTSTVDAANLLTQALRYGFITLPADLARALLIGLLLAGLLSALLPHDLFSGAFSSGLPAFAIASIISLPLYVCATASIPMAYSFMAAGLSPGAALIFLIIGPATNSATIASVWQMIGRRATVIYLASLLLIAWLAGWGFNAALSQAALSPPQHLHTSQQLGLAQHASGLLLLMLLLYGLLQHCRLQKKNSKPPCCNCH